MSVQREPESDPALSIVDRFESWVERDGIAEATDPEVLERLRQALRASAQASATLHIDDPALLEVVLSDKANRADRTRAVRLLGLDDSKELRVAAVSGQVDPRRVFARVLPDQTLRTASIGRVTAVVFQGSENTRGLSDRLDAAVVALFPAAPHAEAGPWIGIGSAVNVLAAPTSWEQAQHALRFASSTGFGRRAIAYERLSTLQVLADIPADKVRQVVDLVHINEIAASPAGALEIDTLEAFCQYGSLRRTAAELHLHHSTVAARIAHIEERMSWDLDNPLDRFLATLVLMLRRIALSTAELSRE